MIGYRLPIALMFCGFCYAAAHDVRAANALFLSVFFMLYLMYAYFDTRR